MASLLGHQHHSEPVTSSDRVMSKRHKAHRREVDAMQDGPDKLKKSLEYNRSHALEHHKAEKKAMKALSKMRKKSVAR